jgi:predicted deacylase
MPPKAPAIIVDGHVNRVAKLRNQREAAKQELQAFRKQLKQDRDILCNMHFGSSVVALYIHAAATNVRAPGEQAAQAPVQARVKAGRGGLAGDRRDEGSAPTRGAARRKQRR